MRQQSSRSKILLVIMVVFLFGLLGSGQVFADTLGEHHTFFVNPTYDATGRTSLAVTLEYVGTHSYFYVEDAYLSTLRPSERATLDQQIVSASQEFDNNIYPKETAFWGSEPNPGIDNDSKITILLEKLASGTGGYFDSTNEYSSAQVKTTNQREMISTNVLSLSTNRLKIFLAHEFQHLISFNQKELLRNVSEDTWLNELRSQYAITVAGYNDDFQNSDLIQRVQTFSNNPEDSLTEWPNTNLDYASVTLFGHYLIDRFGPSVLADTLHSSTVGVDSINKYLISHNSSERFVDLFSDWEWTNYYNNPNPDSHFSYISPNLQTIHVAPTDTRQLTSQNVNSFQYSLKPWESAWEQFRTDFSALASKNIKISWVGSEYQIYYADSSGVEHKINNGNIIVPPANNFLLLPVNQSQTTNFGTTETPASLALTIEYTDQPITTSASNIHDGSLIMHADTPDIYVVWGIYKRYLAPEVLKFYGLDPATAIVVPEGIFQSYMPSNYIREVDEKKVYAVWPDGTKHWLNMSAQTFTDSHRDWNSIFVVNSLESNFYKIGSDITQ